MFPDVLTNDQKQLLPLVAQFKAEFYLVGGTAIALQIGHRRSIDFDLFCDQPLKPKQLRNIIEAAGYHVERVIQATIEEFTLFIKGVKITFYHYPYKVPHPVSFQAFCVMPRLLDLAAMKAIAMGSRPVWKDYVDTYFLLKNHFSLKEICLRARQLFGDMFSEKLYRQQLVFFEDIDFDEQVLFYGEAVADTTIKAFLIEVATEKF
jgi:hypothetical protein